MFTTYCSRLLDIYIYIYINFLSSLSFYMWLSSFPSLSLFISQTSLAHSLSLHHYQHSRFGGDERGGQWLFLRLLSLILWLFLCLWVFDGGECLMVGICCGCLRVDICSGGCLMVGVWWWAFVGGVCLMVSIWWWVFDGWSLMVGIDGGGYFVCVFDGGYWWWWVFVGGGGLMVVVVGTLCGCLTVDSWWWWVFDGGYLLVVVVVPRWLWFWVVLLWWTHEWVWVKKNDYGEERQWVG